MLVNTLSIIITEFENKINELMKKLYNNLLNGKLLDFEEHLYKLCLDLYNNIALAFIVSVVEAKETEEKARKLAQKKGLGEIRQEKVRLQLKTGHKIRIFSWFAVRSRSKRKKKKRGPNGSGSHLILDMWGCINKSSPSYYSCVTMMGVLCPSFEIEHQVLKKLQIESDYKRLREIAYAVGEKSFSNRVKIGLREGENLIGKKVFLSIDGGKTRMREKNRKKKKSKFSKGKRTTFNTPWRETKLFVIQVLEEDGSISKTEYPIYDNMLEDADKCFELFRQYLKELQIDKANEVLFIADGAVWIWNRVLPMLIGLGVAKNKITEAVDYYHAVQHLSKVLGMFGKKKLDCKTKKSFFRELKNDLWAGKIDQIVAKITSMANRQKKIKKALGYFKKNIHRMQYYDLRKKKFPCGSGIIESAIRRIINLRFKSPSSFWNKKNVEKLIFLRGIFLAKRWDILIQNLSTENKRPE